MQLHQDMRALQQQTLWRQIAAGFVIIGGAFAI